MTSPMLKLEKIKLGVSQAEKVRLKNQVEAQ
jgi:hypothetical protein